MRRNSKHTGFNVVESSAGTGRRQSLTFCPKNLTLQRRMPGSPTSHGKNRKTLLIGMSARTGSVRFCSGCMTHASLRVSRLEPAPSPPRASLDQKITTLACAPHSSQTISRPTHTLFMMASTRCRVRWISRGRSPTETFAWSYDSSSNGDCR